MKLKIKKADMPKDRNPMVQHLVNRTGGGVHGKSKKAERRQDKMSLRKEWT